MACSVKSNSDGTRIWLASSAPRRRFTYSNEPAMVSVADVSTVARMRSSSCSRMMAETSIGAARRNTPRLRVSRK